MYLELTVELYAGLYAHDPAFCILYSESTQAWKVCAQKETR